MNTLTGVAVDGLENVRGATGLLLEEALVGLRGGRYESAVRLAAEAVRRAPVEARARGAYSVALSRFGRSWSGIDELVIASRHAHSASRMRYRLAVLSIYKFEEMGGMCLLPRMREGLRIQIPLSFNVLSSKANHQQINANATIVNAHWFGAVNRLFAQLAASRVTSFNSRK